MISEGEYVLLYSEKGDKWLIKIRKDGVFSTDLGIIQHNDIIEKSFGEYVLTHKNRKIWIIKPSIYDYILKTRRRTQIIYPKDIGYIIMKLGVKPDSKILEIGTGSGALTTGLAWILEKDGLIDTYEKRSEFLDLAKENISRINPKASINFHNEDAIESTFKKEFYDIAFLDIDSPWLIIDKVYEALKPSGRIGILLPTYNQVDKVLPSLEKRFIDIEGAEIFKRELQLKHGKIRPLFRMIGFTAILITGIKIIY